MTDKDLSDEVWAVIAGLILFGLLMFFSAESYQKWGFLRDCIDTYSKQECREMWEAGNG